jgi:AbrB family looped-hinge helix DNA binding protein
MSELKERVEVVQNGRITIPKRLREKLGIKDGSILEAYVTEKGKLVIEVLLK